MSLIIKCLLHAPRHSTIYKMCKKDIVPGDLNLLSHYKLRVEDPGSESWIPLWPLDPQPLFTSLFPFPSQNVWISALITDWYLITFLGDKTWLVFRDLDICLALVTFQFLRSQPSPPFLDEYHPHLLSFWFESTDITPETPILRTKPSNLIPLDVSTIFHQMYACLTSWFGDLDFL